MNAIVTETVSPYQVRINANAKAERICKKLMTPEELEAIMLTNTASGINTDAIIMTVLYEKFGFTAEQLRTLFDEVVAINRQAEQTDPTAYFYGEVAQVQTLKDTLGIDIAAWNKEVE